MKLMKWVRTDGLLHFTCSALIVVLAGIICPWWLAAIIGVAIGLLKEIWDGFHGGVASWHDVICDLAGVAVGAVLLVLFAIIT